MPGSTTENVADIVVTPSEALDTATASGGGGAESPKKGLTPVQPLLDAVDADASPTAALYSRWSSEEVKMHDRDMYDPETCLGLDCHHGRRRVGVKHPAEA